MLSNNRVMIGKDRAGVNFARYSLHQPELVTEEGGEDAEHTPAARTLLFRFHCACSVCELVVTCACVWHSPLKKKNKILPL